MSRRTESWKSKLNSTLWPIRRASRTSKAFTTTSIDPSENLVAKYTNISERAHSASTTRNDVFLDKPYESLAGFLVLSASYRALRAAWSLIWIRFYLSDCFLDLRCDFGNFTSTVWSKTDGAWKSCIDSIISGRQRYPEVQKLWGCIFMPKWTARVPHYASALHRRLSKRYGRNMRSALSMKIYCDSIYDWKEVRID